MHIRLVVSTLALAAATSLVGAAVTSAATTVPLTPVGSVLKVGQPAIVPYQDGGKPKIKGTIQITPESIVKGSIKDFANIKLDAAQKTATPYYMKVRTKNVGKTVLAGTRPDLYLNGVDDRGQSQSSIIFFGDFARCGEGNVPKVIKPGQSYETCQAFLIARGGSIVGAVWSEYDPKHPDKTNINWKR